MDTPLKLLRQEKGYTLMDVAKAVKVSAPHLSRIERDIDQASPDLAERLSKYFDGEISEVHILYPRRFRKRAA